LRRNRPQYFQTNVHVRKVLDSSDSLKYLNPPYFLQCHLQLQPSKHRNFLFFQTTTQHSQTTTMKLSLPLLFTLITSAYSAIPVPKGTTSAAVNISTSELRIYHQDTTFGIKEISVGLPDKPIIGDGFIFGGQTRNNTPLAAITWINEGVGNVEVSDLLPFFCLFLEWSNIGLDRGACWRQGLM